MHPIRPVALLMASLALSTAPAGAQPSEQIRQAAQASSQALQKPATPTR